MISPNAKIASGVKLWYPDLSNIGDCAIGEGSIIHSHVWIGDGVKIGKNVRIQAFSFIPSGVTIKDNVFIGPRVTFTNDKYPPSRTWDPIVVNEYVSIGAGSVILPNVIIGKRSIIGAGSVVTRDVPEDVTVFGNPARVREDHTANAAMLG